MYYFYVLESRKDNKYYYGYTANLRNRVDEHLNGKVKSTSNRLPIVLVYYEAYLGKDQATNREATIKRSVSARRALHKRINNLGV